MVERGSDVLSVKGRKKVNEIYSPDKKYKVIVYRGGGGATVSDSIRFAVVPSDVSTVYTSDVVFAKKGLNFDRISAMWKSNTELMIGYLEDADSVSNFTEQDVPLDIKNDSYILKLTFKANNNINISYIL